MRPACVLFLLFLTSGCQNGSFQEILSTTPLVKSNGPGPTAESASLTDAQLATRLRASFKAMNRHSSEAQYQSLLKQIQILHERTTGELDAETAGILLGARLKVFLLKGEQRSEIEKFSLLLLKEFAGQPVSLDAMIVHYMVTRDLNTALSLRDFKQLRANAHRIPSDNDRATYYSAIIRRLHANGQTKSAKLALDMGLAHLKGRSGWSRLFNEQQFALGFKKNPKPTYAGGAFKKKKASQWINDFQDSITQQYEDKWESAEIPEPDYETFEVLGETIQFARGKKSN